jgi:hypothetical protein
VDLKWARVYEVVELGDGLLATVAVVEIEVHAGT